MKEENKMILERHIGHILSGYSHPEESLDIEDLEGIRRRRRAIQGW